MPKALKTEKELLSLRSGDIIRSTNGIAYIVVLHTGRSLIASRVIEINNPDEWVAITINGKRV